MTDEMKTWERHVSQAKDHPPTSVGTFVRFDTVLAAEAKLAEKEAALCRAQEVFDKYEKVYPRSNFIFDLKEALSSSSPCPHAAEMARLREAVEWALKDPIITEDAVLKQYIILWRMDFKYRLEHGPQPRPELRRRAGKEGG